MTTPRPDPACPCGHPASDHDEGDWTCQRDDCECEEYTPRPERASEVGERCGFSFGTPDWVCGRAPDHPFHDHAVSKPHDPSEQCHTFVPTPRPDALTAGERFLAEVERDLRERFALTVAAIERAARADAERELAAAQSVFEETLRLHAESPEHHYDLDQCRAALADAGTEEVGRG